MDARVSEKLKLSILLRIAPRAALSVSTKRQKAAPREIASKPSAPEPAKRSMTRAPSRSGAQDAWASTLNRLSRALSEVGLVSRPAGAAMAWPLNFPDMIRMAEALSIMQGWRKARAAV
jgi:hypothetical protein